MMMIQFINLFCSSDVITFKTYVRQLQIILSDKTVFWKKMCGTVMYLQNLHTYIVCKKLYSAYVQTVSFISNLLLKQKLNC